MSTMSHEFDCVECRRHIVNVGGRSLFDLCAICIAMPGWFHDPHLAARLDADWRPEPE